MFQSRSNKINILKIQNKVYDIQGGYQAYPFPINGERGKNTLQIQVMVFTNTCEDFQNLKPHRAHSD